MLQIHKNSPTLVTLLTDSRWVCPLSNRTLTKLMGRTYAKIGSAGQQAKERDLPLLENKCLKIKRKQDRAQAAGACLATRPVARSGMYVEGSAGYCSAQVFTFGSDQGGSAAKMAPTYARCFAGRR
jgi:hypothetical protein